MDSYLAFDFETSGLYPQADRIIQVGFCRITGGKAAERGGWLVNQDVRIHPEAAAVHGITQADIRARGIPPEESLARLLELLKAAPACVGHNIHQFDLRFLDAECRRFKVPPPETSNFIDTAAHFKGKKLGMSKGTAETESAYANRVLSTRAKGLKYSIPACIVALRLNIEDCNLHDAGQDAYATHLIFEALKPLNG